MKHDTLTILANLPPDSGNKETVQCLATEEFIIQSVAAKMVEKRGHPVFSLGTNEILTGNIIIENRDCGDETGN